MPHTDVHPVGMVHQFQELEHRIQIVHGLTDAHEHDVGDLQPGIQLGKEHLIQHFGRGQIADLSGNGGSHTESGRRSSGTDLWDLGGMVSWGLV